MVIYRWKNIVFDTSNFKIVTSNKYDIDIKGLFTSYWYESTIYRNKLCVVETIIRYTRIWPFKPKMCYILEINYHPNIKIIE